MRRTRSSPEREREREGSGRLAGARSVGTAQVLNPGAAKMAPQAARKRNKTDLLAQRALGRSKPIKTERKSCPRRAHDQHVQRGRCSPQAPSLPTRPYSPTLATLQINVRESANMQHATGKRQPATGRSYVSLSQSPCPNRNICKYSKLCADLFTDSRALGMAMEQAGGSSGQQEVARGSKGD